MGALCQEELLVALQCFLILHQPEEVVEQAVLILLDFQEVQAVADQVTEVQVE
jgi:hypothetical protein